MIKHFAATAYIVSKIDGQFKVLLHKHKKLNIWIGVGGHVEKGENPEQTVVREAKEETNLEITLVNQFCIQEEKIPKYGKEAAHRHIDFIYFACVKNPEKIKMEEEYGWFSLKDLDKMDLPKEAKHASQNAIKVFLHGKVINQKKFKLGLLAGKGSFKVADGFKISDEEFLQDNRKLGVSGRSSMQAVVQTGIGGVNKLRLISLDIPNPKKDEVLIKVLYCGVNHLDILIRSGKRPGPKNFPHILGSEIVGEVEGQKVAVYPWTKEGGTIGKTSWGGYGEYAAVPKRNIIKIPAGLKLEEVCALVLAGTTANHLINRAKIKNESRVLLTGATGGVGTAVLQILKSKKCQIIATTSHKNKISLLKKLGADKVVLTKNMASQIKKLYPEGVEYAIDLVGGSVWSEIIELLSKNGTMVFCATSREEKGEINIGSVFARQLNILGSSGGTLKDFNQVLSLLKKGVLKPVIDSILPLKDAASAHQKMEKQQIFGKILLKI